MAAGWHQRPSSASRSARSSGLLRSELFTIDQLRRHAVILAGRHTLSIRPGPDRLLQRLSQNARQLRETYRIVASALVPTPDQALIFPQSTPTEAWLLDNYYLIEQQIGLVRRHLPPAYSKHLPQLEDGPVAGLPRIYELALELIAHQDGRLDSENVNVLIAAYQSVRPLKLAELWAFPIMLRLALLENLRFISVRAADRRREQFAAASWGERLLAVMETEPGNLIQVLAEMSRAEVALTAAFIEEFHGHLQTQEAALGQGAAIGLVRTWVDHQLQAQGATSAQLESVELHASAADQVAIANSISSLRFIGSMNWRDFVESLSAVEHILCDDPAGIYARQDFSTRDRYRHAIEDIAHYSDFTEEAVATTAVRLAAQAMELGGNDEKLTHVGYYLINAGRPLLEQAVACRTPRKWRFFRRCEQSRLALYLGFILVFALAAAAVVPWYLAGQGLSGWRFWILTLLGLFDAFALSVPVVNLFATFLVPPRSLPRLDFSLGIPEQHRTMVVIPTLIGSVSDVEDLLRMLEIRYLGNRDANLFFALLTDFKDATEQSMPDDAELLAHVRAGIKRLNTDYRDDRPGIFYLFHRPRVWNNYEKRWMGWERKRGKIEQFNALLRAQPDEAQTAFSDIEGNTAVLPSIKYVITLDTDTQLPRDTAHALVGNLAHPLNRPVFDAARSRIVEGYAILQPRASTSLASAGQSHFTRIFAGEVGIDPYTHEVSDVYQDVFAEGSFMGKGIYDVDAFRQAVEGRFPQNLVLSHDLLESAYARSGLVTDVDLIEDHPSSYAIETSRRHRWMRGDWQIAGWILPRVPAPSGESGTLTWHANPLPALARWKIFDNLRRSLVPPGLMALVAVGWLSGAGPAWIWALLVAAVLFIPPLLEALIEFVRKPAESQWLPQGLLTVMSLLRPMQLAFLTLAFLPYEAAVCLDAIARSALRMPFTRSGLLLWHMPQYMRRNACSSIVGYFREMWVAPVIGLLLAVGMMVLHLPWTVILPLLLLWSSAPALAWWIGQPIAAPSAGLGSEQRVFLRMAARRTWRYFAQFVGPDDHWLPPDNFQEHPRTMVASRTSPTNIGMALLANLAAHDFGYIGMKELLARTGQTLDAMAQLERYRGHFLNWYDTRTLQPLWPQYVSSVDSGNLIGCLLTLQAGLLELKEEPVISPCIYQGLEDALQVLMHELPTPTPEVEQKTGELQVALTTVGRGASIGNTHALLFKVRQISQEIVNLLEHGSAPHAWAQALEHQAASILEELELLIPDWQQASRVPTLNELIKREAFAADNLAPVALAPGSPSAVALERIRNIDGLVAQCRRYTEMDFEFLYDSGCHLLSIGYDVGERRRDPSCYDLLASEARLASFLLIAQGKLPQKHWYALGRMLTRQDGGLSLISWSGSMFEYLMPQVIMPAYEDTLLHQTFRTAVARHAEYGRQRDIPWGISESCYNVVDAQGVYQYRAFGVPGLGFKRGLADDLVIAPYATALALMAAPVEACRNLQKLAELGFLGEYGFYEAIDFTPSRVLPGLKFAIVRNFMAHHQGMSLLAYANVLLDQPMQRRFLSDSYVKTAELLLQERIPKKSETMSISPHAAEVSAAAQPAASGEGTAIRAMTDVDTPLPEVQLLSNGRYHVMATAAGGSYSHWQGLAVTRWREDAVMDNWGTFIYLRDRYTGRYWSTALQPTLHRAERYEAIFLQARAEYRRRDEQIETHTEITVSPEDDVEIRRVKLTNLSGHIRHIEVTSYAEVVLAPLNADLAHRTFSNLFVQTEIVPERQAVLCTRRRRAPGEATPWMFHLMAAPGAIAEDPSFETDRAKFIGRGRTTVNPIVLDSVSGKSKLSNTSGPVLDPIVAVRRIITLGPDESASLLVVTGMTETRDEALALVTKYADRSFADRAFDMAWFRSQEMLRHLNATEHDAQVYERLATSVIHANHLRRASAAVLLRNRLGQSGLWRFAISGDLPIVLVRIGNQARVEIVRQTIQAHAYWRMKGLASDLVILNEDFSGYRAVLHDLIVGIINTSPDATFIDKPGGVFVRRAEELTEEERMLFQAVARVIINDDTDTLAEQVERRMPRERVSERRKSWRLGSQQRRTDEYTTESLIPVRPLYVEKARPLHLGERLFFNGTGGFSTDGREYVISLEPDQSTPAPWANVIASPHIGTVISERGSAYTWVDNAHEFRLTPFHNDPLGDTSGEAFYIRDEETGQYWSPAPQPVRGHSGYVCRHGFGYSIFEHLEAGIFSQLSIYVAQDAPVKLAVIKLRNHSGQPRRLSLTGYWELVMGEWRHANLMHVVTETDPQTGALFARNSFGREYANRVVFAQVSETERSFSGSRLDFIGRNGSLAQPAAMRRKRLSGKTGAGLDPCAALQCYLQIDDGREHEVVFLFGAAEGETEARQLVQRYSGPGGAWQTWDVMFVHWRELLGAVQVETPNAALNLLANGWLLYQTVSCRMWARSGYYQSGGAYGFRDQLQDSLALLHAAPDMARAHILLCAEHQFVQGDVQHWWHPPGGKGVRTRFSDDYLWLPYVVSRYVMATGNVEILDESVHFIEGRELAPDEEAYYDEPLRSMESASLYEHCVRAIKHGLRFGSHGLPLIGCGDWNDGMNLVGREGKGESVWLAWFLYENLNLFAGLATHRGDGDFARECLSQAAQLRASIEAHGWDGAWYRRAYFDDGTPLGSAENEECRIDSISQSWSVISGGGDADRAPVALTSMVEHLVQEDARLVKLLTPPFDTSGLEPGYIKGYPPGVRENGGQYTHAAIWAAMAFAMRRDRENAWNLFDMLNPILHGDRHESAEVYRVEPYVMCADVYALPPHTGRGGWTWYTGAAGWMYRLIVETLLGIRLEADKIRLAPCIPTGWGAYSVNYRHRETTYAIHVYGGEHSLSVIQLRIDGVPAASPDAIPLLNDGDEHQVDVTLD